MAKKKKRSRKASPRTKERSPFWRQLFAFLLVVLAIFVGIGVFGIGGPMPTGLGNIAKWALGAAGYMLPFALLYWGITKFRDENHRIPFTKVLNITFLLLMTSSLLRVLSDTKDPSTMTHTGDGGGVLGGGIGGFAMNFLDKVPAAIVFLFLTFTAVCLVFSITPKSIISFLGKVFARREKDEDTDLADLKAHAKFKIHDGVPIEHAEERAKVPSRLSTFKNSAPQKLTRTESHSALTTSSDPDWSYPSVNLLNQKQEKADPGNVEGNARTIQETFSHFNMDVEMEGANVGPRVTQFTLRPPSGIKLTRITALESNIALDLGATSIRIEAPIPGKKAVGIEVPNRRSAIVRLSSVMQSPEWKNLKSPLGIALGKDISGESVIGALDKMPHLLVAGQTGSGKSVMINSILTSLLYRNSPSDLKLILVDPKQVELTPYNDVPHLLTPVITEPEKCISALKWAVAEMERRLRDMAKASKRNISEYNEHIKREDGETMPYIVIVIDELADLMMMAARDVESLIVRLAQKARATGIHLVLATQRPSVNVITGLIKANVPARIAFTVASQVDARTILDHQGAEKLLGQGDMLMSTAEMAKPVRVQGAFIDEPEVTTVTNFLRSQREPQYNDEVVSQPVQLNGKGGIVATDMHDADEPIFQEAVKVVIRSRKASTSLLQRQLRIGYGKAARLMDMMEEKGIIGPADGSRPRDVLISSLEEMYGDGSVNIPVRVGNEAYDDMEEDSRDSFLTH